MFTRRHYEWLARWARDNLTDAQKAALASALRSTNPAFKIDRFLKAADCGPELPR